MKFIPFVHLILVVCLEVLMGYFWSHPVFVNDILLNSLLSISIGLKVLNTVALGMQTLLYAMLSMSICSE